MRENTDLKYSEYGHFLRSVYDRYFSKKSINNVGDLFENNGRMKILEDLKANYDLDD